MGNEREYVQCASTRIMHRIAVYEQRWETCALVWQGCLAGSAREYYMHRTVGKLPVADRHGKQYASP